jgi:hypothetical protein
MNRPSDPLRQTVLDALRREQSTANKRDREMAADLGVGQSMWNMMKQDQKSIGLDTLIVAATRFAVVKAAVLSFFARLGD